MPSHRIEKDSFGEIEVPNAHLWGAQTQRSLHFFKIGVETMPRPLLAALARIKQVAASVNCDLGLLPPPLADAIMKAAQSVAAGHHAEEFPLSLWQTGSGTQTNMNMNEVIANLANESLGFPRGGKKPVHPNDHVNLGQSSNDCFPTAMHIACALEVHQALLPALRHLEEALAAKAEAFSHLIKIGRTHLQDATPISLGQEFSGYSEHLRLGLERLEISATGLLALAQGGTAVGTGLNTHPDFAVRFAEGMTRLTGLPFITATNKFEALAGHDALNFMHGALASVASSLFKIASDIRLMASGPRSGFGEIALPENEPGSSIMPGKVNPTQAEALTMACLQVLGNQTIISMAASQGHFELNVFKPVIIHAALQSIRLLSDASRSFADHCVIGIIPQEARLTELVNRSLMLVTALTPKIGYDQAAAIAKTAHHHGTTLREEALKLGVINAADFDALMKPELMIMPEHPHKAPHG
jgi:fumarate hydratase, class II